VKYQIYLDISEMQPTFELRNQLKGTNKRAKFQIYLGIFERLLAVNSYLCKRFYKKSSGRCEIFPWTCRI